MYMSVKVTVVNHPVAAEALTHYRQALATDPKLIALYEAAGEGTRSRPGDS